MTESGRGWAYVALFSEIGISLLVTTLVGVLAGYWVDEQLGTLPVFLIVGFLVGAGSGTVLIAGSSTGSSRQSMRRPPTAGEARSERGVEPRSCVWSKRVERAGRDRRGRRDPGPRARSRRGLSSRWFLLIGAHHRLQHRRPHPRPAVPEGRQPVTTAPSRPASSRHPRVPGAARGHRLAPDAGPARRRSIVLLPEHQLHDPHDVDRHGDRARRRDPDDSRLEAGAGPRPERLRVRSTSS